MDYLVNNEYIREVLCINKEKPKLSCNGKCYLMQQLQEKQSKHEQELPQLLHSKYEFVFFRIHNNYKKQSCYNNIDHNFPKSSNVYTHFKTWDIFHPPRV